MAGISGWNRCRLVKGADDVYVAVPWFWSDQGKFKLQIAGLLTEADQVVAVPQPDAEPIILLFRDGRLAAVETINAPGPHMAARRLIGTPFAQVEAHGFDLRAAMKAERGAA